MFGFMQFCRTRIKRYETFKDCARSWDRKEITKAARLSCSKERFHEISGSWRLHFSIIDEGQRKTCLFVFLSKTDCLRGALVTTQINQNLKPISVFHREWDAYINRALLRRKVNRKDIVARLANISISFHNDSLNYSTAFCYRVESGQAKRRVAIVVDKTCIRSKGQKLLNPKSLSGARRKRKSYACWRALANGSGVMQRRVVIVIKNVDVAARRWGQKGVDTNSAFHRSCQMENRLSLDVTGAGTKIALFWSDCDGIAIFFRNGFTVFRQARNRMSCKIVSKRRRVKGFTDACGAEQKDNESETLSHRID